MSPTVTEHTEISGSAGDAPEHGGASGDIVEYVSPEFTGNTHIVTARIAGRDMAEGYREQAEEALDLAEQALAALAEILPAED